MDLETENCLAALLMEEARRLHLQADKEGVGIYFRQPKARGCPNARFLTATILGVQQANRAVEVNEMWQAREKELELDNRISHRPKDATRLGGERHHANLSEESANLKHGKATNASVSTSSSKQVHRNFRCDEDHGLRDEEVEEFLQSRLKRGRGAVGSRMDEPGPYPVCTTSDQDDQHLVGREVRAGGEWKQQILGPEKPSWLTCKQHEEDSSNRKTTKEDHASRSKRWHSEDKYPPEKSGRKRRNEKPRHHHHRSG